MKVSQKELNETRIPLQGSKSAGAPTKRANSVWSRSLLQLHPCLSSTIRILYVTATPLKHSPVRNYKCQLQNQDFRMGWKNRGGIIISTYLIRVIQIMLENTCKTNNEFYAIRSYLRIAQEGKIRSIPQNYLLRLEWSHPRTGRWTKWYVCVERLDDDIPKMIAHVAL